MNDLDLRVEVVSRSCQPLRDIRRWISRKPLEIEAWFQRIMNRKRHLGYQMVTWPMTSRDPRRCCEAVRSAIRQLGFLLLLAFARINDAFSSTVIMMIWTFFSWFVTPARNLVNLSQFWCLFIAFLTRVSQFKETMYTLRHRLSYTFPRMGVDIHKMWGHGQNINRLPILGIRTVVTKSSIKQIPWSVSI